MMAQTSASVARRPAPGRARGRRPGRALALAVLCPALLAGCQTPDGPLARWRMAFDHSMISKDAQADSGGPLARLFNPKAPKSDVGKPVDPGTILNAENWNAPRAEANPEAAAALADAQALYQKGDLPAAEKAFKVAARKFKETPWGETAQYYLGETRYQRGNFVGSHDAFQKLNADYPGTKYLEEAIDREWSIAQDWLAYADPYGSITDEQKAQGQTKPPPPKPMPWNARFTGRLPLVDTCGHALQVLEHVQMNSPFGEHADDAALRIADYYYDRQDYELASDSYDQLLKSHNKSPYLRRAYLSSIDAKIKAYRGPEYDGNGLEEARALILQYQNLFPERLVSTDDALNNTLALIDDQQAERAFRMGEHYRWTGHVGAAEYCFGEIPARWPQSRWTPKAKVQLAELAKMPRESVQPSKIMTQPGAPDPYSGGMTPASAGSGMSSMGGMGGGMPSGAGMGP